jgi:hypothetical protein
LNVVYEFVVADRSDSQLLAKAPVDQLPFPYFRCFPLDPANLATLYFLINDQPYRESYLQQFDVLHHDHETCNSLVEMPDSLCESLASLPRRQLRRVVVNWQQKGIDLDHWQEDFVRSVLLKLMELSKQSRDRDQSLLLKVCVDAQPAAQTEIVH